MQDMSEKGILPKIDSEDLVAGYTTMVGVTKPLDPEKYPQLKGDHAHFQSAWTVMVVPGNVITWGFSSQYKSLTESKKQMFMISEWGPEHNQSMIDDFYNLPCPYGGIMGDLIDATPKDLISKVYLEHKMFQTWHYKRSILVGDACHKMLPAGGQVALNAFHDTVILANCLYDLKDTSQKSITSAFQSYYEQRFPLAKMNYNNSQVAAKLLMGATWTDRLVRTVAFKCIPDFLQQKQFATMVAYRPQANFLPTAPHRGSGQEFSQPPSVRYTKEQAEKNLGSFCPVAI
ncbi:hypothetical protein BGZ83_002373 [Gryganskiella cystojenkinii]|nr:hypothetical protein BGZ83_002373 [Gryganskiella cystojenkinii]